MNQQRKDNSGALFRNDRKEKETQPDRKGQAVIGGVEYWISAWNEESKEGKKYVSLKFEAKDEQRGSTNKSREAPPKKQSAWDDD